MSSNLQSPDQVNQYPIYLQRVNDSEGAAEMSAQSESPAAHQQSVLSGGNQGSAGMAGISGISGSIHMGGSMHSVLPGQASIGEGNSSTHIRMRNGSNQLPESNSKRREIGDLAVWALSSAKQGNGVD